MATETFLRLEGDATGGVVLEENDFSRVARLVEAAPEVPQDALTEEENR